MKVKVGFLFVLIGIICLAFPSYGRENSGEFGFGLYSVGYFFPMLSTNVESREGDFTVDTDFDGQNDFIHNIQFTYGITSRVFFQLSAGYYQGSMDVLREYQRFTEERKEQVTLVGDNDFKIMPISFGLGTSFLKEGKFDPYAALGFTFFRVKVDTIDLVVDDVIVRDLATGARLPSAEKELREDFFGTFIERDYDTEIGYYADLGLNYFFLDNLAVNTEFRYYFGRVNLYELADVDFNIGGFAVTCGLKFTF